MKQKKKVRKKLKLNRLLIFLLLFFFFLYFVYCFFTSPIKNIYVIDNKYFSDQEIIDFAEISNYPKFYLTRKDSIRKRIEIQDLVKEVKVEKRLINKINIYVTEYKPLFYKMQSNVVVLESNLEVTYEEKNFNIPIFITDMSFEYYNKFIEEMTKVHEDIINKISQIEYKPNDIDKERFILYMDDGNYVYLTLLEFDKINNYNNIVLQLEGKRGILYLDSGDYFEIIE